ncbi:MAG: pantoate--beta-alanine ligase, partial [Bacteroidales bacterium]
TEAMRSFRSTFNGENQIIGFVPTMGALHEGHLSLVTKAEESSDVVIVSIFVNPTQFNDPEDLKNYPRDIDGDLKLLSGKKVDAVFIPGIHDIYPHPDERVFDFGGLDKVMEGKHRPGHFNGVAQVVSKLLDIVNPHKAFFGQKDYQQLTIIRELARKLGFQTEIISCPIIREDNGLAMSSRNQLLTEKEKSEASDIYKTLVRVMEKKSEKDPEELAKWAIDRIDSNPYLDVEYFEIVNASNLQPLKSWGDASEQIACTAVKINNVRLIDNMIFP